MKNRPALVLLSLAGVAWTSAQALLPDMGLEEAERLAAVAAAPGRQSAAAGLLMLAGSLLVVSAVILSRTARTGRGARLIRVGTLLLALGGVWLVAGRGAFSSTMLRLTGPEIDSATAVRILSDGGGPEFAALLPTLPALLLGPVLLAVGVRRAGLGSWLPLTCWVLGIGAFVAFEFTNKVGETLGVAVASAGLVLIGLALTGPATRQVSGTSRIAGWRDARRSNVTAHSQPAAAPSSATRASTKSTPAETRA